MVINIHKVNIEYLEWLYYQCMCVNIFGVRKDSKKKNLGWEGELMHILEVKLAVKPLECLYWQCYACLNSDVGKSSEAWKEDEVKRKVKIQSTLSLQALFIPWPFLLCPPPLLTSPSLPSIYLFNPNHPIYLYFPFPSYSLYSSFPFPNQRVRVKRFECLYCQCYACSSFRCRKEQWIMQGVKQGKVKWMVNAFIISELELSALNVCIASVVCESKLQSLGLNKRLNVKSSLLF